MKTSIDERTPEQKKEDRHRRTFIKRMTKIGYQFTVETLKEFAGESWADKAMKELESCPCCDQGIKPCRGWIWIGANQLLARVPCQSDSCDGKQCLFFDLPPRAGLLWVGSKFYSTPDAFTREAAAQGISRRIAQIPNDFKVGETLVFLAHREVEFCWGQDPYPGIFAAFIPSAIEYILRGDETQAELERLMKQGCTLVGIERRHPDAVRKAGTCGGSDLVDAGAVRPARSAAEPRADRPGREGSEPVCEMPGPAAVGTLAARTGGGVDVAGGLAI